MTDTQDAAAQTTACTKAQHILCPGYLRIDLANDDPANRCGCRCHLDVCQSPPCEHVGPFRYCPIKGCNWQEEQPPLPTAQGAPGEQAWVVWLDPMAPTHAYLDNTGAGSFVGPMPPWLAYAIVRDHNAVRELREALDGLLTKYEKVVEMYVRPNMDYRAKDSSGDVEYTAARTALAHAQGAGPEIPAMWSKDDPPDYVGPVQGAGAKEVGE